MLTLWFGQTEQTGQCLVFDMLGSDPFTVISFTEEADEASLDVWTDIVPVNSSGFSQIQPTQNPDWQEGSIG